MDSSQTTQINWIPFRQARVVLGAVRHPTSPKTLPRPTLCRWTEQLGFEDEPDWEIIQDWNAFPPEKMQILYEFAGWLQGGGTVDGFISLKGLNRNGKQRFYSQPQSQQRQNSSEYTRAATATQWDIPAGCTVF